VPLLPIRQFGKEPPDVLLVANEVVVHNENCSVPTQIAQRIQLSQHLLVAFGSRHAPVNLDDVAELAVERTPTRVLHRHPAVKFEIGDTKICYRRY
jgi:hypothetical protein